MRLSLRRRPLRALQVELTSRCRWRCAVCPRTALAPDWPDGDLGEESLDSILDRESRRRFLAPLRARLAAEQALLTNLVGEWGPSAIQQLDQLDECRTAELGRHPFPAACEACPKRVGW